MRSSVYLHGLGDNRRAGVGVEKLLEQRVEIARTLAVEVCTACTQISAIRARTAALDILSSQHMLPVLPPVVWAIRVSGQR